jgi:hypothetical protein
MVDEQESEGITEPERELVLQQLLTSSINTQLTLIQNSLR